MYNLSEIKGFCIKSRYIKPSSNLFMNVMQYLWPDLLYGTLPGALRSDGKSFFWSSLIFGRKMLR